jgi:DNA-binding PadR family transcriptional regulator
MLERDPPAVPISKDLVAASAVPLVLSILQEGESYGYAIIRRVSELSEGRLQWTEGMLYPVLHRLEAQALVSSAWRDAQSGRRRKYYRIRREGLAELESQRVQWDAVLSALRRTFLDQGR